MALAPKYAAQAIVAAGVSPTIHTVELFLDYVCPFSAKMWKTVHSGVFPQLESKYQGKVRFILRQQIQPWHPSSTLVHEAAAAVLKTEPSKYIAFSTALFERQNDYFDVSVVNESRNQTYKRLSKLAGSVGVEESKIYDLLKISEHPGKDGALNIGNEVTNDIKNFIKIGRLVGIHVSPTVLFNGLVENSISSSFTAEQWGEWLEKNVM